MAMYGSYLRISVERLKELQSQPEVFEDFLGGARLRLSAQYFSISLFWDDLHTFLEKLPLPSSIWRDLGDGYSKDIGTQIENVSYGVGSVRFLAPDEVQAIANALKHASQEDFMNRYRENYPTRDEEHYDWALSTYIGWKQFLQKAAEEGQAVLFWIT